MEVLRAFLGIIFFVGVAYLFSNNRKAINWKQVVIGFLLQVILGLLMLKVPAVFSVINAVGAGFVKITSFAMEGAVFIFGDLAKNSFVDPGAQHKMGFILAFQVLPLILFFATLTTLLYYFGILQKIVKLFALIFTKVLGISGPEALSAAGNIFIGQAEAPMLVKPFLKKMNQSEILCIMSIGMCTIAGSVMAAYVSILGGGNEEESARVASQLLTASIMNVPAGLVLAKIVFPNVESSELSSKIDTRVDRESVAVNAIDAIAKGASEGIKLAVNVGGMLLAFVAIIALFNFILKDGVGNLIGVNDMIVNQTGGAFDGLSMQYLFGQVFRFVAFVMGVEWGDTLHVASLLGQKTVVNEFVAYLDLARMKSEGLLNEKSIVISTFALCGFSNFSSIAIQSEG